MTKAASPSVTTRPKHVPQRTCVGCRTTSAKRDFARIVRTPEGSVEVDVDGRRSGRGAYVCANRSCWEAALKGDRLARALRTTVSAADREALRRYSEQTEPADAAVGS
ncbi:MAG: YlxR family protein [Dehalococcoidia bacterium]